MRNRWSEGRQPEGERFISFRGVDDATRRLIARIADMTNLTRAEILSEAIYTFFVSLSDTDLVPEQLKPGLRKKAAGIASRVTRVMSDPRRLEEHGHQQLLKWERAIALMELLDDRKPNKEKKADTVEHGRACD